MHDTPSDIAFSPAVKAAQQRLGSRTMYEQQERAGGWLDVITPPLAQFIAQRDSFYLGTASKDGQPYIQHRGGPPGFLKVLDEQTLAFADFFGNQQYITVGNLSENNRVVLFLMDYPNRRRLKIWGTAEYVEDDAALLAQLAPSDYPAVMRAIRIHVQAWDMNCKQHITPRYTEAQITAELQQLRERVRTLEAELRQQQSKGGRSKSHERKRK